MTFYENFKKYIATGAATGIVLGSLGLAALVSMIHSTSETEIGVRTKKITLFDKVGVEDKVYEPGQKHFFFRILNDWSVFDTKLVNVEMTATKGKGDREEMDDLRFKTIDGNDIGLDVILAYRIDPKKAPYIRQFVAEDDDELKNKVVRTVSRSKPRDIFGELNSEEFYDAEKRNEKAEKAKLILQEMLLPYGVIVEKVALKDYRFNSDYENAIKNKKLADAKTLEFRSQINAQLEMNKQLLREADGQVNEMRAKVDGLYQEAVLTSDAFYDQQEKIARATIAEGEAEAAAVSAKRIAMTSAGSETMVKMKIAENLKGKRILMIPGGASGQSGINLQTFDTNQFLEFYGIKKLGEEKK